MKDLKKSPHKQLQRLFRTMCARGYTSRSTITLAYNGAALDMSSRTQDEMDKGAGASLIAKLLDVPR